MFCGFPINVAAEPALAAHASASRNGRGSRRRCAHVSIKTGATARHTTSLLKAAESAPTPATIAPSRLAGATGSSASRQATRP